MTFLNNKFRNEAIDEARTMIAKWTQWNKEGVDEKLAQKNIDRLTQYIEDCKTARLIQA